MKKKHIFIIKISLILAIICSCRGTENPYDNEPEILSYKDKGLARTYMTEKGYRIKMPLLYNSLNKGDKVYLDVSGECTDFFSHVDYFIAEEKGIVPDCKQISNGGHTSITKKFNTRRYSLEISEDAQDDVVFVFETNGYGSQEEKEYPKFSPHITLYINPRENDMPKRITYRIEDDVLYIDGYGDMEDYKQINYTDDGLWHSSAPWTHKIYNKVVIDDRITYIGANAFGHCSGKGCSEQFTWFVSEIHLPECLEGIGYHGFWGIYTRETLYIPSSVIFIARTAFDTQVNREECSIRLNWSSYDDLFNVRFLDGLVNDSNWGPGEDCTIFFNNGVRYLPLFKERYEDDDDISNDWAATEETIQVTAVQG